MDIIKNYNSDKWSVDLYAEYKGNCLNADQNYVSYEAFKTIHERVRKYLLELYEKKGVTDSEFPICVIHIDDNWMYWGEIQLREGQPVAVANLITPETFEQLFATAIKEGEHI